MSFAYFHFSAPHTSRASVIIVHPIGEPHKVERRQGVLARETPRPELEIPTRRAERSCRSALVAG
jgi:hypothetical protein